MNKFEVLVNKIWIFSLHVENLIIAKFQFLSAYMSSSQYVNI